MLSKSSATKLTSSISEKEFSIKVQTISSSEYHALEKHGEGKLTVRKELAVRHDTVRTCLGWKYICKGILMK